MGKILNFKKILWAVDAFQPDQKSIRLMAEHVALFAREFAATVDIVFSYRIPAMLMVTRADRHSHEALGSITRKTVRKATVPVLALRH